MSKGPRVGLEPGSLQLASKTDRLYLSSGLIPAAFSHSTQRSSFCCLLINFTNPQEA